MRLRDQQDLPPSALLLESPYDPDARFHTKRETSWIGYTVHLTETCDEDTPDLITQVAAVPASTNDVEMTGVIQADLAARDLLPGEHLVDAGYVSGQHVLVSATTHGIDLVGPAPPDTSWQATADAGFGVACFAIDGDQHTVTCPQGKTSRPWSEGTTKDDRPFYQVRFKQADCRACPVRPQCTRSATKPRQLALRPREEHAALQAARQRQTTPDFKVLYALLTSAVITYIIAARTTIRYAIPNVGPRRWHICLPMSLAKQERSSGPSHARSPS